MSDNTIDPDIERLVRSASTLRDLVANTVMLADRFIDYDRYVRETNSRHVLSGLNAAQRFDRVAKDTGGFDTEPELVRCGNCFYFSILGYAHELFVALPGLTDADLAGRASEVVQAICDFPEEYLPETAPDADAEAADVDDATFLRDCFAAALTGLQGWFMGTYAPPSGEPLPEANLSEAESKRLAEFEKRQDPGWEPKMGGSCNFVMAE